MGCGSKKGAKTPAAKAPVAEKTEPAPQEGEPEKTLLVTPEQPLPEDATVPNKIEVAPVDAPAETTVPAPEATEQPKVEEPAEQVQTGDAAPEVPGTADQVVVSDPAPEQPEAEKKEEPVPETDLSKTSISIPVTDVKPVDDQQKTKAAAPGGLFGSCCRAEVQ